MSRGTYDYGLPISVQSEYTSDDLYELAARQNIFSQSNRSGNVIWNMGDAILTGGLLRSASGSGYYALPSCKWRMFGRDMLKVFTGTVNTDYYDIQSFFPPTAGTQKGIAAYMMLNNAYGIITLSTQHYRTTKSAVSGIRVNVNTGVVEYINNALAWTTLGTYPVSSSFPNPFIFKYSFDVVNHKYGKLWYGSELIADLSSLSCYDAGYQSANNDLVEWRYTNATNGSLSTYLSDVIVTTNELI